ncbi:MAG: tetratricopeptide repeat protein [Candidatus Omnitrophica bacterium]|nr:tetratricopeptide repeat protein [Candidatus Omnitrophota bacterium]MCM8828849.1 tetratricopeptide repeat protein [Candidatus Omnitrophota bacterium]
MRNFFVLMGMVSAAVICFADLKVADSFFKGEKWSDARRQYETLLPELKGQIKAEVLYKIGYTYEREGKKFDEAIETYRKEISVDGADDVIKSTLPPQNRIYSEIAEKI